MMKSLLFAALLAIIGVQSANTQRAITGQQKPHTTHKATAAADGYYYVENYDHNEYTYSISKYFTDNNTLDPSYGTNGTTQTVYIKDPTLLDQPDGRIVVVGLTDVSFFGDYHDQELFIAFKADGTLDQAFANNGYLYIGSDFSYGYIRSVNSYQSSIIVEGYSKDVAPHGSSSVYYNVVNAKTGAVGYIRVGSSETSTFDLDNFVYSLTIKNDKLILGGVQDMPTTEFSDDPPGFTSFLSRYDISGHYDPSFSQDELGPLLDSFRITSYIVKDDNKILVAGEIYAGNHTEDDFQYLHTAVYRINADGTIDNTFGTNGELISNLYRITIALDGTDILVSGYDNHGVAVTERFDSNGHPKTTNACPADTSLFTDKSVCSAVVHGIDPTGSGSFTYTLSGATTGSGSGTASGLTFNKGITTVTYTGSSTCSFNVTVKDSAVSIVTQPVNKTVCSGSTVEITIATKGLVSSYQWYKNNVSLGAAQQTATLKLVNVSKADAAQYKVLVKGSCNMVTSGLFTLKVNSPLIVSIPTATTLDYYWSKCRTNTVYKGYINYANYAVLLSKVSGGKAPYTYKWSTGATIFYVTVNPAVTTTYTLTVTDAAGCTAVASRQIKVLDVRCGANLDKVLLCHSNTTLCVSQGDVESHLKHGDCLGSCGQGASEIVDGSQKRSLPEDANLVAVKAGPNPSSNFFNIEINSKNNRDKVYIKVTDLAGRLIEEKNVTASQTIHLGAGYATGIYLLQAVQGNQAVTLKLLKQ